MGRPYLRLELGGGEVAETHVGALFVVVPPPAFNPDFGFHPVPKPLEEQAFVPARPVERFVRVILPGLARIDERRVDLRRLQSAEQRGRDELRTVLGPQIARGAVEAHQLSEHVNHPPGPDASRHIDRQALTRERIDERQALQRPAIRARVEDEVIGPHVIPRGRELRLGGHPKPAISGQLKTGHFR